MTQTRRNVLISADRAYRAASQKADERYGAALAAGNGKAGYAARKVELDFALEVYRTATML